MHHFIVMVGFGCPTDPTSHVVGGCLPLVVSLVLGEGTDKAAEIWANSSADEEAKVEPHPHGLHC